MSAVREPRQPVRGGACRQSVLQILVLGHIARDRHDPVDLAGARRPGHAKRRLDPDFALLPVLVAIGDPGLFSLTQFQGGNGLPNPRQILRTDACQSGSSDDLAGILADNPGARR
jgi:hypothetical protein